MDIAPTILAITETPAPADVRLDGEPLVATLLGQKTGSRSQPIFFRRPPDQNSFAGDNNLPDLAVRSTVEVTCEYDGYRTELYDLSNDPSESKNVADEHKLVVKSLRNALLEWHQSLPPDNGPSL